MPHSQDLACKQLVLAVLIEALTHLETIEDYDWLCNSPDCEAYLCLLNFKAADIFRLRLRVLLGLVDRGRLDFRKLDAQRFKDGDKARRSAAEAGDWTSWSR